MRRWSVGLGRHGFRTFVKLFGGTAIAGLLLTSLLSQESTLQIGYGRIEPEAGGHVAGVALYSSSNSDGVLLWEAAVGAVRPIERGRVYVEETARTRTALALANPGDQDLILTAVLRNERGVEVDRQEVTLPAGTQTAEFVDQRFADALSGSGDFLGTLTLETGDSEARFAAVTLRENLNHRGEAIYATLPVADLDAVELSPSAEAALAFPQVGGGGGLTTQLVLVNPTGTPIEGHVELFQADGSPLLLSLESVETSEVSFSLEANGVFRAELTSAAEVRSGYAVLHVDEGSPLPSGTAIFQLKSGDQVITEAGVPATVPTHHVRMLVDNLGTRTGVAVAPLGDPETPVRFDLKEIDAAAISSVEATIGEVGHARYADEIFPDLRPGFLGILEVSSEEPFAAVTLKLTTNSRGEPVLTTLPVADLSNPPDSGLLVIPQIGLGLGLETRLIVLGAEVSSSAQGSIDFVRSDSTPMEIPVFGTPQSTVAFEIAAGGGWRFDPTTPLEVSDILLDREISLAKGQSLELSPAVVDNQGVHHMSVPLYFQSTRPDVASVNNTGTLVGRKAGFATLVVSAGEVVRSTAVTVVEATSGLTGYTINHLDADTSGKLYLSSTPNQVILQAQSFEATPETYAGIDQRAGYHDDLRLSALFDAPSFVTLDRNTNTLYLSDGGNGKVRTVTPGAQGAVSTLDLNGPALGLPQGLALDDEGYLWVADSANHTIGRIDLETNDYETIAGQAGAAGDVDGTATQARFHSPHGLAVERESTLRKLEREARGEPPPPTRILVADTGNGTIRRITRTSSEPDADWKVETVAINLPNVATRKGRYRLQQTGSYFTSPTGISVDAAGNIYVSDTATGEVSLILPTGSLVPALPAGTSTESVAVTPDGRVLVTEGDQGAREITYAAPEVENVLRTPAGSNQERITIVGRNFAAETEILVNSRLITDAVIVDSERITFLLPRLAISGGLIQVQNRGGLAQFAVPFPECKGPIVFEDPNLEAAVREALGLQPDAHITCEQAQTLDSLNASRRFIQSMKGLQSFTGLSTLSLHTNVISDISPLQGLTRLTHLDLDNNGSIADISALAGLTQLGELYLGTNHISDISALQGLAQLRVLSLYQNQISDTSALRGLSQLRELVLYQNQISDISPLQGLTQLSELWLDDNQISDISPLQGLSQLSELRLYNTQISDISALQGLSQLSRLWLNDNQINDISPLQRLTQLTSLFLSDNQISDVSALAGLTQLRVLYLSDNQISDISALLELHLVQLMLDHNPLDAGDCPDIQTFICRKVNVSHDVVCHSECQGPIVFEDPNLETAVRKALGLQPDEPISCEQAWGLCSLGASDSFVRSLSGLEAFTGLRTLSLSSNQISDISALQGLTQLSELWLNRNQISDISALEGLTQMQRIDLDSNSISDISALAGLTQLTTLSLYQNQISDISALQALIQLSELWLVDNQISDLTPLLLNPGIGANDSLWIYGNLLDSGDCPDIQELIDRGVDVQYDVVCP